MRKPLRFVFKKPDRLNKSHSVEVHSGALERTLIVVVAMLVMAIGAVTELRVPPEFRVGNFEKVFASP